MYCRGTGSFRGTRVCFTPSLSCLLAALASASAFRLELLYFLFFFACSVLVSVEDRQSCVFKNWVTVEKDRETRPLVLSASGPISSSARQADSSESDTSFGSSPKHIVGQLENPSSSGSGLNRPKVPSLSGSSGSFWKTMCDPSLGFGSSGSSWNGLTSSGSCPKRWWGIARLTEGWTHGNKPGQVFFNPC